MLTPGGIAEPLFAEAGDVMSLQEALALGLDPAGFCDEDAGTETES